MHNVAKSTMALFLPTSAAYISMGGIIMMVPMGEELQPLVRSKESHGQHHPHHVLHHRAAAEAGGGIACDGSATEEWMIGRQAVLDIGERFSRYLPRYTWKNRRLPSPPQINSSVRLSICPSVSP